MTRRPDSTNDLAAAQWRKSSFSGGGTGSDCVELAVAGGEILVRDSKDPEGPVLRLTRAKAREFFDGIKAGDVDGLT